MITVVGRLFGNETMQELRQREDGAYVMRTFNVDHDSNRVVSMAEAGEWVDTMRCHGGAVYRNITGWPAKAKAKAAPAEYPEGVSA